MSLLLPLLLHPSWGGDSSWAVLGTGTPVLGTDLAVGPPASARRGQPWMGTGDQRGLWGAGPLLKPQNGFGADQLAGLLQESATADPCSAWGAPNRAPLCPSSASAPAAAVNTVKKMFCAVQRGRGSVNTILKLCLCVSIFAVGRGGSRDAWGCQLLGLALENGETSGKQQCLAKEEYQESPVLPSPWCSGWVGEGAESLPVPMCSGSCSTAAILLDGAWGTAKELCLNHGAPLLPKGTALLPLPLAIADQNKAQGCGFALPS